MKTFISDISKKEFPASDKISGRTIRHSILNSIQKENPDFTADNYLSASELNYFREKYISDYLRRIIQTRKNSANFFNR